MKDIEIYNKSLDNIGIVDTQSCLIWDRKYFEAGNFEIHAPINSKNVTLLKKGYIVSFEDSDEFGIIDTVQFNQNDSQTSITVKGLIGKGILNRRKIWEEAHLQSEAESAIRQLVDKNAINPSNVNRVLAYVKLGAIQDFTETIDCIAEARENLLDYLIAISQSTNIGFELFFDKINKQLKLECRKGTDRSTQQMGNPHIEFSQEYDNLRSCDYLCSDAGKVNCVKAQYSADVYSITGDEISGWDRFEGFVEDSSAVKSGDEIDISATKATLLEKAKQSIAPATDNFEGEVDFTQGYKTDYDLGDIVTVFNNEWDVSINNRIYEVQEVYDENGIQIIPVFGSPAKTINDILKKG